MGWSEAFGVRCQFGAFGVRFISLRDQSLYRAMQKQRKAQQKMLAELKNGDVVVTSGGIVGTIVSIGQDDTLILRVKPDNLKLQVARSGVASVVTEGKS